MLLEEPGSPLASSWRREDPEIAVWALTALELAAGLERRCRLGNAEQDNRRAVFERLDGWAGHWLEISDLVAVRRRARPLLARHSLRAADAAQLAAALVFAEDDPTGKSFVCLDRDLAHAAEREGFRVLTWPTATT